MYNCKMHDSSPFRQRSYFLNRLLVNTNLAMANWVTPSQSVPDNGTIKYITVNPPTGNGYYRLKSP